MAQVTLRKLVKNYDETPAVRGIDLDIGDKEFVVLVGPSGCGKSTTLRMIAGLEDISSGEVLIGNEVVNDMPPKDRNIAMVFQNYALYPHMTVYENMSFGLRLKKVAKSEIRIGGNDVTDLPPRKRDVAMVFQTYALYPHMTVAENMGFALKIGGRPKEEIKKVHQKVRTTTVYVTHDQVEAMTLADRVVVMNAGRIEQVGTPNDLYHFPATKFVAGFIGSPAMNFVPCTLEEDGDRLRVRLT